MVQISFLKIILLTIASVVIIFYSWYLGVFFSLFIYLFLEIESVHAHVCELLGRGREGEGKREPQTGSTSSMEPYKGLHPTILSQNQESET